MKRPSHHRAIALAALAFLVTSARVAVAQQVQLPGGASLSEGKEQSPKYYGLQLNFSIYNTTGINSVNYNNSVDSYFIPSWNFGKLWMRGTRFAGMSLSGRLIVSRSIAGYDDSQFTGQSEGVLTPCANLTPNANGTLSISNESVPRCSYDAQRRTADWSDVWLQLRNPNIYSIPKLAIGISPTIRVVLPASLQSQVQTMQASLAAGLGFSRAFLDGKIALSYGLQGTKFFHRSTSGGYGAYSPASTAPLPHNTGYSTADVDRNSADFYVDRPGFGRAGLGAYNNEWVMGNTFVLNIAPIDVLSITLMYVLNDAWTYDVPCAQGSGAYDEIDVCAGTTAVAGSQGIALDGRGKREAHYFGATLNYQPLDWLGISASWNNFAPRRKPDGTPRQPFFSTDYNAFTTISVGVSIQIDGVASKIEEAVAKKKAARFLPPPPGAGSNVAFNRSITGSAQSN